MPTTSVQLSETSARFIEARISDGSYRDASEAVSAALKLLENQTAAEEQEKLAWLRSAIMEGADALERGEYATLTSPEEIHSFLVSVRQEAFEEEACKPSE